MQTPTEKPTMSTGLNKKELESLTEAQRLELRRLYTSSHRQALEQMTILRQAAQALQELDEHTMEKTQQILGGADRVRQIFGVPNPLGVEEDTEMEEYEDNDGNTQHAVRTISFEDLLDATQERHWFLEQFSCGRTFQLPHEEEGDGYVLSWR